MILLFIHIGLQSGPMMARLFPDATGRYLPMPNSCEYLTR